VASFVFLALAREAIIRMVAAHDADDQKTHEGDGGTDSLSRRVLDGQLGGTSGLGRAKWGGKIDDF